jgi:hypothetical protein
MQPAERRAVAGASETAGSLVFRPRERPPTRLHQAPSRLQGSAPSPLSTTSGAAEPKSLSRLLPNNGEMEPTKMAPSSPGHCSAALINARFWTFGIETRLLNIFHSVASSARASSPLAIRVRNACAPPAPLPHFLYLRAGLTLPLRGHPVLEHMLSHKPRGLLSGANKGGSRTRDANRWVNGKVCHTETNVRLIRQFRVGWILEWRAPAGRVRCNIGPLAKADSRMPQPFSALCVWVHENWEFRYLNRYPSQPLNGKTLNIRVLISTAQ